MKALIYVMLMAVGCACSSSLEQSRATGIEARTGQRTGHAEAPERCIKLDNARTKWGAVAKVSGALAGGAGVSTIPLDGEEAQIALASSAAVFGAVALGAVYLQEQRGASWARECSER